MKKFGYIDDKTQARGFIMATKESLTKHYADENHQVKHHRKTPILAKMLIMLN